MKRFVIGVLVGGALGVLVGVAATVVAYPFIFLNDIVATETLRDVEGRTLVAEGAFIHANASDPVHYGSGKVSVFNDTLRLEPDFVVGPGPKYKVLLHTSAKVRATADVGAAPYVDLGQLRAFKGSQNFAVPKELKLADYKSVVIWCEAFGVLISPADLKFR